MFAKSNLGAEKARACLGKEAGRVVLGSEVRHLHEPVNAALTRQSS